jgi:multidrug efflux pump subunit AcrB
MSRRSVLLISLLIILAIGGVVGYKMWNKPFTDPREGDAITVTAVQLFNDFSTDETSAQKKYVPEKLGNIKVQVTGQIMEIGKNNDGETFYTLKTTDEMFGVKCIMDKGEEIKNAKTGDSITVRGFCDGYNMDVIVNRCKIIK